MTITVSAGPRPGFEFAKDEAVVWNRTGATLKVGNVVMFDMGGSPQSETVAATGGAMGNVVLPATVGIGALSGAATPNPGFFFAIVTDLMDKSDGLTPGRDNSEVKVAIRGRLQAQYLNGLTIDEGEPLFATNGLLTLTNVVGAGLKALGYAREAVATTPALATGTTYEIAFDGEYGYGAMEAS